MGSSRGAGEEEERRRRRRRGGGGGDVPVIHIGIIMGGRGVSMMIRPLYKV